MTIPTIAELESQIVTAIEGKIGQTVPAFIRAFFRILAKGVAGVLSLGYRFASWCLDQTQPATANEFWLTIWGNRYGVIRAPAVAWRGTATATGINGTDIPAGTLWQTSANVVYSQESLVTIAGGTATVTIKALTRGTGSSLADTTPLTTVSPIAGSDNTAEVASTLTDGVDKQPLEEYRAEVMNRIAYRPQGGAIPDYVIWAREVPGIVAAFVEGGGGDVTVYPLIALTGVARVPGAPKIAEVLAYLTDPIRKPLGANIFVLAATERTCAVTVTTGTIGGVALTTGQKISVEDAVYASIYASYPKQYPDQVDPTDQVEPGMVWDALRAIGATAADVSVNVSGIGGPHILPIGEIVKPGVFTWA